MLRRIAAAICLSCFAAPLLAHEWPHWRGPMGDGVGVATRAPEHWSPTRGISWRAEIEGYGISSPVIAGNRVYVTTAIAWEGRSAARLACDGFIGCLAVLGIPMLARRRWALRHCAPSHDRTTVIDRGVRAFDLTVFGGIALAVLVFGIAVAIGPGAIDFGLGQVREVLVRSARLLGRHQTNLFFLHWDEGARHNTWIISSAVALASAALIPFVFPGRLVRVAGATALVIGLIVAKTRVPWGLAYGERTPTGVFVVLFSPVVAVAAWHLLVSVVSRPRRAQDVGAAATATSRVAGVVPALLSAALFVSPNYLHQREMVTRRLICLDATSGKRIWQSDVFTTPPEAKAAVNSHATPTPVVAKNRIVAAFGPGIAAFGRDGELLWSRTYPDWIGSTIYGAGSSPVTDGETVFVMNDREYQAQRQSRVIAYSLTTGEELWSTAAPFAHDGYATPVIYDDGYQKVLYTLTSKALVGYLASTGALAWKLRTPVPTPIPSPVAANGRLYVTGGMGGDGYTAAYQLRPDGAPDTLWANRKGAADVSSPVVYQGRLFTMTSTGIMACYDANSGKIIWRARLGSGLGVFYASLMAADGKVYAVRSNGTAYVVAAEDEFRLLSESALDEEIFASPAIAAGRLYLRTVSALYCIEDSD